MNNIIKPLNDHKHSIYSQHGEDGIIEEIINRIDVNRLDKWCVELGAWDGIVDSNTYNLIKNKGYKGVLIEGNKTKYNQLCKNMPSNEVIKICKFVNFEGENSLEQVLIQTPIPKTFDFISIDIDGCDYFIFEHLVYYRPKIVCVEFNTEIPNEVNFIQQKNFDIKQGCSPKSIIDLSRKKNYSLAAGTFSNLIFVDQQYKETVIGKKEVNLEDIRNDHDVKNYIFSTYDGTIFTSKSTNLHWHKINITHNKLQILPKIFRQLRNDYSLLKRLLFYIYREFKFPGRILKKIFKGKKKNEFL